MRGECRGGGYNPKAATYSARLWVKHLLCHTESIWKSLFIQQLFAELLQSPRLGAGCSGHGLQELLILGRQALHRKGERMRAPYCAWSYEGSSEMKRGNDRDRCALEIRGGLLEEGLLSREPTGKREVSN